MPAGRTSPSLDEGLIGSWRTHLRAANLAPRTIQSYEESARQLGAFLHQQREGFMFPVGSRTFAGIGQVALTEWPTKTRPY